MAFSLSKPPMPPPSNDLDSALDALKALADPSRLRVFWLLAHIDERICVSEAMEVLAVSHYNASRHLTILKQADLVRAQRQGKWVFYTLNREGIPFVASLIAAVRAIPAQDFAPEIARCRQRLARRAENCLPEPPGIAAKPRRRS